MVEETSKANESGCVMWVMVDVESNGPWVPEYSMIQFGAIVVEPELNRTFRVNLHPLNDNHVDEALKVVGVTHEETLEYQSPVVAMIAFKDWLKGIPKPMFISDNPCFDWKFIDYYLWKYTGGNPFGFSGRDLGALFKGCERSMFVNFKHLRRTRHSHDPLDDARGNAEAMLEIGRRWGVKGILP